MSHCILTYEAIYIIRSAFYGFQRNYIYSLLEYLNPKTQKNERKRKVKLTGEAEYIAGSALKDDSPFKHISSYYGLKSSSSILLSGVTLSGLGLADIINPTVWLVASISAMGLAYSLRSYISAKYWIVLLCSVAFILLLGTIALAVSRNSDLVSVITSFPFHNIGLSYFGFLLFGLCISITIISYKKMSLETSSILPERIINTLNEQIYKTPLFFKEFKYEVEISDLNNGTVELQTSIQRVISNRTSAKQIYSGFIPTPHQNFTLHSITIGDEVVDLANPTLYSKGGVNIQQTIDEKSELVMKIRLSEQFPDFGSELYTVYRYPTEQLKFHLLNHSSKSIKTWVEPLHNDTTSRTHRNENTLHWESSAGILPNQGLRLFWSKLE